MNVLMINILKSIFVGLLFSYTKVTTVFRKRLVYKNIKQTKTFCRKFGTIDKNKRSCLIRSCNKKCFKSFRHSKFKS